MPSPTNIPLATGTNSSFINPLLEGNSWSATTGTAATIAYDTSDSQLNYAGDAFAAAARGALAEWAKVANLTFTFVSDWTGASYHVNYGDSGDDLGTTFIFTFDAGSIWTVSSIISNDTFPSTSGSYFQPGGRGYATMIHEIGHGLGLAHPDTTDKALGGGRFASQYRNIDWSIMNDSAGDTGPVTSVYGYSMTPQWADILAIQYLYGANMSTNAGDTAYTFATHTAPQTIWDAGGADIINASAQTSAVQINLNESGDAASNVGGSVFWLAYGSTIEAARGGSGGDTLTGNARDNQLYGNRAADTISGNAGNDYIRGGRDSDSVQGGDGVDSVAGDLGNDFVYGNARNDSLRGGKENDAISGGDGTDSLWGDLGNDTLTGGAGADVFLFGATSGADTITDFVHGTDHLQIDPAIFASVAAAIAAFSGSALNLGGGNTVTLTGITSIDVTDVAIG